MTISRRARRRVLQSMLAAPVLAGLGPAVRALGQDGDALITAADQALDIFDFERAARRVLPPAHWGYLATGVDADETLHANRAGFANYSLRVRRMVDLGKIDMSVNLFGTTWKTPIFLDPVGSQRAFHAEGELAVARAARSKKHLQFLSTVTSTSVEDVTAARGAPIWYQLYPTDHWPVTQALVRRARLLASLGAQTTLVGRTLGSEAQFACELFDDAANTQVTGHNKMVANLATERATLTGQVWKFVLEELKADLAAFKTAKDGLDKAITAMSQEINTATIETNKKRMGSSVKVRRRVGPA